MHKGITIAALALTLSIQVAVIIFFSAGRLLGQGVFQYGVLVGLQMVVSVPIGVAFTGLLRYHGRLERGGLIGLIVLFNGFIPVIGLVVMGLSLVFMRPLPPVSDQQQILSITRPDYVPSLETLGSKFGDGGARVRLFDPHAINAVRRSALLAISSRQGIDNNRLLLTALNENNDEIRLLAYSLLDLQEQAISRSIEQTVRQLEKKNSQQKVVSLTKNLARLHQELVYRSLVQADVMEQAQQQAIHYAQSVAEDATMSLLLGQIYRKQGKTEDAQQALERAHQQGAPPSSTLPALAEIYFQQRQFSRVTELLAQAPALRYMQKIGHVAQFWSEGTHGAS